MIQDQVYNCITVPIDYYLSNCIFYNYNDQTTDQYIQQLCIYLLFQWTYLIAIHRQKILDIFEAKALRLMSLEEVLKHFQQWREEYPDSFELSFHPFYDLLDRVRRLVIEYGIVHQSYSQCLFLRV